MARTRAKQVALEDGQREMLAQITKSRTEETRRVERAKVLLMAERGDGDDAIAQAVSLNKNSVRNTIAKFHSLGMDAALGDLARPGRPPAIGDDDKTWVINLACQRPKDLGYAQELWTYRLLAEHIQKNCTKASHPALAKVSHTKVRAILDEHDIKPHRIRYYLERRDEDFESKMNDVLIVYKQIEIELEMREEEGDEVGDSDENGTVTVSYDEKPGIQAIANTAPDLAPTEKHGFVGRDYEYKRLGTVTLLAGMNLITGEITGLVRERHRSREFIEFLKELDRRYADAKRIRIVLDNHSAHISKETRAYLEERPGRFDFVFTPKHGSWLNLIESFFGKFARVCLKGIRVKSKEELVERIYRYLEEINEVPVVYHWKYKMDEVTI
jgi:transposase